MQLLTKIEAQLREILVYGAAADPEVRSQLQPWRRQLLKMIEKSKVRSDKTSDGQ